MSSCTVGRLWAFDAALRARVNRAGRGMSVAMTVAVHFFPVPETSHIQQLYNFPHNKLKTGQGVGMQKGFTKISR